MKGFKEFLSEKTEAGGADYEAAIVVGYYLAQGLKVPDAEVIGISLHDQERIFDNKNTKLKDDGIAIAKALIDSKKIPKKQKAEKFGSSSVQISEFWSNHGGRDTTPKTDLIIANKKISLKIGPSRLMSGGRWESEATFYAALENTKKLKNSPEVKAILGSFENFVLSAVTKQGGVGEYTKKNGEFYQKDALIKKADKTHKEMTKQLQALFQKSEDFKIAFTREAMSGEHKFNANSQGIAEYFLIGNKGSDKVMFHDVENREYIKRVADIVKIDVSFKSNSTKERGVKTGKYRYFSIVNLALTKLNQLNDDYQMVYSKMLSEGNHDPEQLWENLFTSFSGKVKEWFLEIYNKVKEMILEGVDNIMEFLDLDPEVKVRGMDEDLIQFPI